MNKTACLLNTPELGGAERSFLSQLGLFENKKQFDLFFPIIEGRLASEEMIKFVFSNELNSANGFDYDSDLYKASRSSKFINIFNVFIGMLNQVLNFRINGILSYDKIWCNGNKVFVPLFFSAILFGYKGKIFWHLRDYPSGKKLEKFIRFFYLRLAKFNLILLGNSDSTVQAYQKEFLLRSAIGFIIR